MPGTDQRDFEAVYLANATRFRILAAQELRSAGLTAQAEDVVAKAVEDLLKKPPKDVDNWDALIVNAIKFRAKDLLKSAAVRHADHGRAGDGAGDGAGDDEDAHDRRLETGRPVTLGTYQDFDPVEASERATIAQAVRAAVGRLDPPADEIVRRIKLEDEPAKDVAADLDKSPGRISQILKQALQQLADDSNLMEVKK